MSREVKRQRTWREYRRDMIRQKFLGFVLLAISAVSVFIDGDATFALMGVPVGAYLMVTIRCYMYQEEE